MKERRHGCVTKGEGLRQCQTWVGVDGVSPDVNRLGNFGVEEIVDFPGVHSGK